MVTWRRRFDELSAENEQQVERWKEGAHNHAVLRASMDTITQFLRQYVAAGQPDRDTDMPTP